MPYGRGGAGNYEAAARASEVSKDLEANHPSAQQATLDAPSISSHDQYAFSGRGGSGNYYSPSGLTQTGAFTSTSLNSSSSGTKTHDVDGASAPTPAPKAPPPFAGRGGAGNYALSDERKLLEDEIETQTVHEPSAEISDQVRKDVDAELAKPPQAHLSEPEAAHSDIWYGTNVGI